MTKREFYQAITEGTIDDEIMAFAAEQIVKMDAMLEARKNKMTKKQEENAVLATEICGVLGDEPLTATDVAGRFDISVQKASSLLRGLVRTGGAQSVDVKIPKKGVQKGYTAAKE